MLHAVDRPCLSRDVQEHRQRHIIVLTADDELMVELVYKVLATDGAQRSFGSCMQSFAFVLRLATST